MLANKRRKELIALAFASLALWVFLMGTVAFFYLKMRNDAAPVIPGTKAVALSSYQSQVETTRTILFRAVPAFASGYLLLGLLLLGNALKASATDSKP